MTDFDADLIAARNAMLARELPDMHRANDFNDNIGVPKMDELKRLSDAATQGVWGQYHGRNGPWQEQANADDYTKWDSTHDMSTMTDNGRYPIGHFKHADTAAFVEALVNAYRAGDLVPASQLAEAQAREAVAYEVAAELCRHSAGVISRTQANEFECGNDARGNQLHVAQCAVLNAREDIVALTPTHTKAALDRIKAEARNAALDEAIEAITFEAEGRKKQMDAHEHDAVQHERFRIGELQSRLNVKNVAALKTEPTP